MSSRCWLLAAAMPCAVFLSGCAGDGVGGGAATSQFDRVQREVFNVSCITGPCHNSQSRQGDLNLAEGSSYGDLVGVLANNEVARAAGLNRVVPSGPDTSFLLIKLTEPAPGEGSRMPLGAAPLSSAQLQLVRDWIIAGAPAGSAPTATPAPPSPTELPTGTPTETVPAPTATLTPSPELSATPTAVPPTPSATATVPSPTPTTPEPTITGTRPATATPSQTPTVTRTPTITPTSTVTPTPTMTGTPTGTPTPTLVPGSTLPEIQRDIFDVHCAIPFCHTDADARFSGNLSLQQGSSHDQLVGVQPDNLVARQQGLLRVDPGNPDNSFIIIKLLGPAPDSGLGARMPQGELNPLPAEMIDRIRAWITRGALPNG